MSVSVVLCETAVCFVHDHEIGTNVWLLNVHNTPPDVIRLLSFQRDNIVWKSHYVEHSCLVLLIAYRMLCSLSSMILVNNSWSIRCPVGQCEPDTGILTRFARIHKSSNIHCCAFFFGASSITFFLFLTLDYCQAGNVLDSYSLSTASLASEIVVAF